MREHLFSAPKTIRITNRARNQLITIKRRTGLEHWNVICRWAFAMSLSESTPPPKLDQSGDSNVEMTWDVFTGGLRETWHAVGLQRYREEPGNHETFAKFIRAHIHRGIQMLSARNQFLSIEEVLMHVVKLHNKDSFTKGEVSET